MKRSFLAVLLLVLAPAGTLLAQEQEHAEEGEQEHMEHAPLISTVAPLHEMVKGYLIASAEQMPEELYGFKPNEEVRSFGQIIGHVASALYMFCGTATGDGGQAPENFENRTTKAGFVEAIKMGFAACDAAYEMDNETAMEEVDFFGNTGTRLWVLSFNNAHNWEHYGNLVVYFRANGMVPPSSAMGGM